MADQIPDALLGFVLENVSEYIRYNADLIGGLAKNTQKLHDDLKSMKAFIKGYTESHTENYILEQLADDVRIVVHQVEDAIEDHIICVTLQHNRKWLSKSIHWINYVYKLTKVGKRIQEVSVNVNSFYNQKASLGLKALKIATSNMDADKEDKIKAPVVEKENVVGFEKETVRVIELLTEESEQLEIVSIIGMFGLGKTTLAKKVLNDPKVEYHNFFPRVFVKVSQQYDRKKVLINILTSLPEITTTEISMKSEDQIIELIHKQLETHKYLIVMDDVWTQKAWEELKAAFPNNKKQSRVLITSQHLQVATCAHPSKPPYELTSLTKEKARELLRRKVFGENACPPELQEYEERILVKCRGLPLTILVIAGMLISRREMTEFWEIAAASVNDYVADDESQSHKVIKQIFDHLPYHLKPCFLYLGVFREDFEIPAWKILRLWIAEGFIQRDKDMTMEDIANDYLEDLVDRNLMSLVIRRPNGRIKTCSIHDTLRDFCKKEASKQKLFHEIKKFDDATTFQAEHPLLQSYRRVSIHSDVYKYVSSKPSGDNIRSFLSFAMEEATLHDSKKNSSSFPKAFRYLRVLDVWSLKFTRFPKELFYLVLLKYFVISGKFNVIPKKLSNLRHLQTIIIHTSNDTLEMKADIWKLALLRHLLINASTYLRKGKLPSIVNANLQTLSNIAPECFTPELIERSPRLRKLGICGKLATVIQPNGECALFESLVQLEFLEKLKLVNDEITNELLHVVLPRENNFPRNLKRLTLMNTMLDWTHISTIGKLQKLEVLKLKDNAFHGELWDTEDGGFLSLKVLLIVSSSLVNWKANRSPFPILTSLYLRHCANLEAIPTGIGRILTLHTIDLYFCNLSVAGSARKIQMFKLMQQKQQKNNKTGSFNLAVNPPDQ